MEVTLQLLLCLVNISRTILSKQGLIPIYGRVRRAHTYLWNYTFFVTMKFWPYVCVPCAWVRFKTHRIDTSISTTFYTFCIIICINFPEHLAVAESQFFIFFQGLPSASEYISKREMSWIWNYVIFRTCWVISSYFTLSLGKENK